MIDLNANLNDSMEVKKIAMVIAALGKEKAAKVYKYLDENDVKKLTVALSKLGHIEVAESEKSLEDFFRNCLTRKAVSEGGIDYARAILEESFGEKEASELLSKISKYLKNRSFAFMNGLDGKNIKMLLQGERAQTIALVLSYVEPETAAKTLVELEAGVRIKVVEQIAHLESALPEVVQLVEKQLYKKLEGVFHTGYLQIGGIDYTAQVMNFMDRGSEKFIFDEMTKKNPDLVDEIRKRMFIFEDIINLDTRAIQRILRDCDPKDVVYALKNATSDMRELFFANMSSRMSETVREDLELLHDVRLSDVEDAQQRIVALIRALDESGEIIISKFGKGDIVA